jgi:hypothetical protein
MWKKGFLQEALQGSFYDIVGMSFISAIDILLFGVISYFIF